MKRYFEQLTPQERRIVVGAGLFVFLLLNYFFVWGRFGEWGREVARMNIANNQMNGWQKEIRNRATYERKIQLLEADGGQAPTEDNGIDLIRYISERAVENQITLPNNGRPVAHTNSPYTVEREVGIQAVASEPHLVNFLYSLGSGGSAVRVKSLTLHPDGTHALLNAGLTIVASYQIKPATKSRTPTPAVAPADKALPKAPGPAGAGTTNKAGIAGKQGAAATVTTNKPGLLDRIGSFFGRSPSPAASSTNKPAPGGAITNKATLNR